MTKQQEGAVKKAEREKAKATMAALSGVGSLPDRGVFIASFNKSTKPISMAIIETNNAIHIVSPARVVNLIRLLPNK